MRTFCCRGQQKEASADGGPAAQVAAFEQLQQHLGPRPLVAMHLFSSISATLGNSGQANYAAANAVLDAAARTASAAGVPASAGAWGPWSGAGMAVNDPTLLARLARQGMGAIPCVGLAAGQYYIQALQVALPARGCHP